MIAESVLFSKFEIFRHNLVLKSQLISKKRKFEGKYRQDKEYSIPQFWMMCLLRLLA